MARIGDVAVPDERSTTVRSEVADAASSAGGSGEATRLAVLIAMQQAHAREQNELRKLNSCDGGDAEQASRSQLDHRSNARFDESERVTYSEDHMRWAPLKSFSMTLTQSGRPCEGHSLTEVADGELVVKFGGGCGRDWLNELRFLETQSFKRDCVNSSGPLPLGRTGHCAAALGQHSSCLLDLAAR